MLLLLFPLILVSFVGIIYGVGYLFMEAQDYARENKEARTSRKRRSEEEAAQREETLR